RRPPSSPFFPYTTLFRSGEGADLGTQLNHGGLAFGVDLSLSRLDDAISLGVSLCLHVGDDLSAFFLGLGAQSCRFGTTVGEPLLILGQSLIRFGLHPFGLLDSALDARGALIESAVEGREDVLPDNQEDDQQADGTPDDVIQRGEKRVLRGRNDVYRSHLSVLFEIRGGRTGSRYR